MDQLHTPEAQPDEPVGTPSTPWSLGDIIICVVGGVLFGILLTFLIMVAVAIIGGRPSEAVMYMIGGGSIYVMVAVFVWLRLVRNRGISWEAIGFRPVKPGVLLLMVPLTLVLFVVMGFVAYFTDLLFGDVPDAGDQLAVSSGEGMSIPDLICFMLVVAIVAPIVEELVFRGLLQRYVKARRGIAWALVISSITFSIFHFIPVLLAVFFFMGLAFGLVAEKARSLYPAIVLHSLSNAVSVMLLYASVN